MGNGFIAKASREDLLSSTRMASVLGITGPTDKVGLSGKGTSLVLTFPGETFSLVRVLEVESSQGEVSQLCSSFQKLISSLPKGSVSLKELPESLQGSSNETSRKTSIETPLCISTIKSPPLVNGPSISTSTKALRDSVLKVQFASATDSDRPSKTAQTGVAIIGTKESITAEAYRDSFIAVHREPVGSSEPFSLVIPRQVALFILKLEEHPETQIQIGESTGILSSGISVVYFPILSKAPRSLSVVTDKLPSTPDWVLSKESVKELVGALQTNLNVGKGSTSLAELKLGKNSISVNTKTITQGNSSVVVKKTGQFEREDSFFVDTRMVYNALCRTDGEVSIYLEAPGKPLGIRNGRTTYVAGTETR